mmetsp:Transcript_2089/g.2956  ORF Transcript_2089/g.2956 Transcript_2089/m.2956 type:complete len:254 (+) Transcript_2089:86-847(+)
MSASVAREVITQIANKSWKLGCSTAQPQHAPAMAQLYNKMWCNYNPMVQAFGLTEEDHLSIAESEVQRGIETGCATVITAIEESSGLEQVAGLAIWEPILVPGQTETINKFSDPKFWESLPKSNRAQFVRRYKFWENFDTTYISTLSEEDKKANCLRAVGGTIKPEFFGCGIGLVGLRSVPKGAQQYGHLADMATTIPSQRISQKLGMEPVFEVKYQEYMDEQGCPFEGNPDMQHAAVCYRMDLDNPTLINLD